MNEGSPTRGKSGTAAAREASSLRPLASLAAGDAMRDVCAPADLFLPASCRRPACAKNGSTDDQGHLALAHSMPSSINDESSEL
jgi:hypothetical protein